MHIENERLHFPVTDLKRQRIVKLIDGYFQLESDHFIFKLDMKTEEPVNDVGPDGEPVDELLWQWEPNRVYSHEVYLRDAMAAVLLNKSDEVWKVTVLIRGASDVILNLKDRPAAFDLRERLTNYLLNQ
jgi:hypothetical protein